MRPRVFEECGRRLRLVLEFGGILLAWIRLGIGLFLGRGLCGRSSWGRFFSWGHGVCFSIPFSSLFLSVSGGSGVLSHGAVFGLGFLFYFFSFSFLCGHWDFF